MINNASNSKGKRETISSELPWVEKYRPLYLKDVIGNEGVVKGLKRCAAEGFSHHILLAGPPGVGKTTSIYCLAREILGEDLIKQAVLELNASDDRGIDIVRNSVKTFAKTKVNLPPGKKKIVILDEADSMTQSAQQALRRIMEIYSETTRFALACNTSEKIIEPIQSRCLIMRFGRLQEKDILKRLMEICQIESVNYNPEGLEAIIFTADGDMRQAINNLQSTYSGFEYVNAENVYKVCDQPHPGSIREIILNCSNFKVDDAMSGLSDLWKKGYSAIDIVTTFFRVIRINDEISENIRMDFIKEIGCTHMKILNGVSTFLQLSGLVARLCMIAEDNN
ncbi:hypothetical protein Glove_104g35 [Diversispora epigaea]|uniref:Replication factor C subunit 4 n=1 Tax=Diversispora epigaea TaxID=1348612 RepID=A0A397J331_9GLOM|nr:hypothetical protein Glove_104g35 [Diversispora epigaea]